MLRVFLANHNVWPTSITESKFLFEDSIGNLKRYVYEFKIEGEAYADEIEELKRISSFGWVPCEVLFNGKRVFDREVRVQLERIIIEAGTIPRYTCSVEYETTEREEGMKFGK